MIPMYAEPILKARKAGMRPADTIIVAIRCDARRHIIGHQVVLPSVGGRRPKPLAYDFGCLLGLDNVIAFEPPDAVLVPYLSKILGWPPVYDVVSRIWHALPASIPYAQKCLAQHYPEAWYEYQKVRSAQ